MELYCSYQTIIPYEQFNFYTFTPLKIITKNCYTIDLMTKITFRID